MDEFLVAHWSDNQEAPLPNPTCSWDLRTTTGAVVASGHFVMN